MKNFNITKLSVFGKYGLNILIVLLLSVPALGLILSKELGNSYIYPLVGISIICLTIGLSLVQNIIFKNRDQKEKIKQLEYNNEEIVKASHRFIVDMIVELRRPLHGIIGTKQLFDISHLNDEEKSYFEIIDFCSAHLEKQLERIQYYSESESLQAVFENKSAVLSELIDKTIKELDPVKQNKELVIGYEVHDDVPISVYGKMNVLQSILHEILENAVKYTYKGSVRLDVKFHPELDDTLLFQIKDTGPGISASQQEMLFNAFSQKDNNDVPWGERGSGLGLSITKTLSKQIGGSVWVESDKDSGSTFFFTFPLETEHDQSMFAHFNKIEKKAPQHKKTLFAEELVVEPENNFARILVVDDEHFARKVIVNMLNKMGFYCDYAVDGEEAITKANQKDYDLILMDIRMPKVDGWEASKAILKQKKDVTPTIVALTSHTRPADKKQCQEAGMSGFISKPIRKNELVDLINSIGIQKDFSKKEGVIKKRTKKPEPRTLSNSIVNFDKLFTYFDQNLTKCKEVLNRSRRTIKNCKRQIEKSYEGANYKELGFQVHHLRGTFAYLMCEEGEEICIKINEELQAEMVDNKKLDEYYNQLNIYTSVVLNEIEAFMKTKEAEEKEDAQKAKTN